MNAPPRLATSWDRVEEVWLKWPEALPPKGLERAREVMVSLCTALSALERPHRGPAARLRLLAATEEGQRSAAVALGAIPGASVGPARPTAPLDGRGPVLAWGAGLRRQLLVGQGAGPGWIEDLGDLAREQHVPLTPLAFALERGSLETDDEGTALLTREHWLRPGWNANFDADRLAALLREELGLERILWLDRGLRGDPAHGQVHRVARFLAPGRVLCMREISDNDPQAGVYRAVRRNLAGQTDAAGRPLEVIELPAPPDGRSERLFPRSHLGFLRCNQRLVVPTYGQTGMGALREAFAAAFPAAECVFLRVTPYLEAGGSLHAAALTLPATLEPLPT